MSFTRPGFKNPKITEFQTVIPGELSDDLIEKRLDYRLNHHALCTGVFGNSVDKLFFWIVDIGYLQNDLL